jgi:hypothetical protein
MKVGNSSAEVPYKMLLILKINIYRELAGGVTTSFTWFCKSYSGQSALLNGNGDKMQMKCFKKPTKFIKFALGENVKQSNWEI